MGFLLGKHFMMHAVDSFNLKDIDPNSISIENACEPFETSAGPSTGWNCEDKQGKFLIAKTVNSESKIHEESTGLSWKSGYTPEDGGKLVEQLCKKLPGNGAYCDEPERKNKPSDLTSIELGFSTPEYAKRFAKAFKHAVTLCGGKPSAF